MNDDADVFADALERPASERPAFVVGRCTDPAQRLRILALLEAHEKAGAVLPVPGHPRLDEPVSGMVVGRFKLLEKIGEGGCGVVWMADQLHPIRRRVAVKIIKLGMDTKAVVARFEAERQALALMDHPFIARVFEAGSTDRGRPYFAMELVRGQRITRYCDERKLTQRERLTLFAGVCRALQHAHERGIVHRDIKPSNVLVTHDGDAPMPKVIDFGIAKATQGRLTDSTLFTGFEQVIGTPAYMSPEQADFHAHEIDARSDVYSLGALLYELLAGRPPFDPQTLSKHGIDEVRRIVREVEPPRPSTQLTNLPPAERATLAQSRGLAPLQHAVGVRGDLDWIVMKALEKNRARRYESAAALAADITRHLAHQPIVARPPRAGYVLRKFVRRHRLPILASSAVAGALALGAVMSVGQSRRADRAERLAATPAPSQVAGLVPSRNARPPPPPPASAAALARARAFVGDLRENFFAGSADESREDEIEARADETIAALEHVPPEQRGPDWKRDHAWAATRKVLAQRRQAKTTAVANGETVCAELEDIYAQSNGSDDVAELLAIAWTVAHDPIMPQRLYGPHPDAPQRAKALGRAEGLLLPLVLGQAGPTRLGHTLAEVLLARAETQNGEAGLGLVRQALTLLDDLDAPRREGPAVLLTRARLLSLQGRYSRIEDNVRLQGEVITLADTLLAHPVHAAAAQRVKVRAHFARSQRLPPGAATEMSELATAERLAAELSAADPSNDDDWYWLLVIRRALAVAMVERDRIADAVAVLQQTAIDGGHPVTQATPVEGGSRRYIKGILERIAILEANRGNTTAADQAMAAQQIYAASLKVSADSSQKAALSRDAVAAARVALQVALPRGDYASVVAQGEATLTSLTTLLTSPLAREADRVTYASEVTQISELVAEAYLHLSRFTDAETVLRRCRTLQPRKTTTQSPSGSVWLACALARQGRAAEAREVLSPPLRELRRRHENHTAHALHRELLALALFVEALAQPPTEAGRATRASALAEAQTILTAMSEEARHLFHPRVLQRWIAQAQASGG
jgi:serine/threonine protein kinase